MSDAETKHVAMVMDRRKLEREIAAVFNRMSVDTWTQVPDYILAEHVCKQVYDLAQMQFRRDSWFGREKRPDFPRWAHETRDIPLCEQKGDENE